MSTRRVVMLGLTGLVLATSGAVVQAAPISVSPQAVNVNEGTVTIVRVADDDINFDYTVTFEGSIADHGWTFSGTMGGSSHQTDRLGVFPWFVPIFTVTSSDGSLSGTCGGHQGDELEPVSEQLVDGVPATPILQERFDCELSRNGSTPWWIRIDSTLPNSSTVGNQTTFSGLYRALDVEPSLVEGDKTGTHGSYQLVQPSYFNVDTQMFGPLRLFGQIVIGSQIYRGELVTTEVLPDDTSDCCVNMPPLNIEGTGEGGYVTGTCAGVPDIGTNKWTGVVEYIPGWTFTCHLALNSAAPVEVTLRALETDSDSRGEMKDYYEGDGFTDTAGTFTAG